MEHGKCKFGVEDKGPKFDLLAVNSTRSIFIDRKHDSKGGVGVGWRNLTGLGCRREYKNSKAVSGTSETGRWKQGEGCDPRTDEASQWASDKNILGIVGMGTSFTHQENINRPCKLPHGYWWLCGDGQARKA